MKEWREYASETDGSWAILADKDAIEAGEDLLSINGEPAVMKRVSVPSDFVSVAILPAARIVDAVKKTVSYNKQYYLQIYCMDDGWSAISSSSYGAEEAVNLARRFVGLQKKQAQNVWSIRKMGKEGSRIDFEDGINSDI